jgi:hypothetical protein
MIKVIKVIWDGVKEFWELANFTPVKRNIALACICLCIGLANLWPGFLWLLALAPVAFIQNMFFTLVSRSRNSQDTDYHRFCAWGSNGVWFICQVMIVKNIWTAIMAGQWWYAIAAGIVYSLATTEGSVLMMKRLIKTEKGKRRVGANDKIETLEQRIQVLERMGCVYGESNSKPIGCVTESKPMIMGLGAGSVDGEKTRHEGFPVKEIQGEPLPEFLFNDPEYGKRIKTGTTIKV